ncbi:cupredoxin domain-containing protein [Pseudomarimonas salicorniae]|uniref:Plastocyanin/azurin family copper-binding protein n=1 Tax=Pseudomarimonas salicorniae TaxID=2933270 RepID=A0ABT0GIM4_9GAMM|nr:plastocyanin/azurin family copper-binding protein [Lysobacter sp. CAU 1642]MCK7593877.1 plastocyanin/azurin family copper-binding protein [Lysobacter sp. CAU 1642]
MKIWHRTFAAALLLAAHPVLGLDFTEVDMTGRRFVPQEVTISVGDTVIWRNRDGFHNIVADDGSFTSGNPNNEQFAFEHTFDKPGIFGYHCSVHGAPGEGMHGKVIVQRSSSEAGNLDPNSSGSWFNPQTDGQGFLIEVSAIPKVFTLAWFTWGDNGAYDWLTAAGNYTGPTATLVLSRTRGGAFNDPKPVQSNDAGTASFRLTGCDTAEFTFSMTDPPRSGTIPLRKLLPDPLCPTQPAAR